MHRLLSVPALAATLAGATLLAGCGNATGVDQAGDDTASSAPPSASVSASATDTTTVTATDSATPSASTSSTAATLPTCASVWTTGATLPFPYDGCTDGDRTVAAAQEPCEIGKPLVTYRNSFWATPGGPVHQASGALAKDPAWHRALVQCGG